MHEIIEQLKDFCDCLPDMEAIALENNINELIQIVSQSTCWANEPCETFLNSKRREIMNVDFMDGCRCGDNIIEFTPYYKEIKKDTFKVFLIIQKGLGEEMIELDSWDFNFHQISGVLKVDMSNYLQEIVCESYGNAQLLITYDAGYELIPECLLQLFCDLLHMIADKNNCDCSGCQSCGKGDDIVIEFDDVSSKNIDIYLSSLIEKNYKKQLELMSLCRSKYLNNHWGTVV